MEENMTVREQMVSLQRILLTVLWSSVLSVSGTLVKPRLYEVRNVSSSCTSQTMKIRLELNRNFQGVVYAKGFPLEKQCRSLGTGSTSVDISIDTSGCGVRLISIDDQRFTFRVNLNIQTDKFLQQINDLEISAACSLSFNDMVYPRQVVYWPVSRTGRNQDDKRQDEGISKIKTWMEIEGTSDSNTINKVAVGEETMVLIKSFLPETLAAKVTDCYAYDGTKDVAQKLIDEHGCPIDETIMPSLEIIKFEDETFTGENEITWDAGTETTSRKKKTLKGSDKAEEASNEDSPAVLEGNKEKGRLQIIGTMFSAFKFPDTSNLHLRCSLEICNKICPTASCNTTVDAARHRMGKTLKHNRNTSSVIDKIEVFNSVEVVAPGIDSDGYASNQDGTASIMEGDENSFCLSASKMAFSFAILGAVFLCGVLAALWTVMRNHLRKINKMDGSEQILVGKEKIYNYDRFIPSRTFINFDAAYYNFFYKRWDLQHENEFSHLPYHNSRAEFRKKLEKLANFNQRLFQTPFQKTNKMIDFDDQIWPCTHRKKPYMTRERMLDLPEFNRGFHLANTIDWGPQDIIVTSVLRKIIIGSGFSGKRITTEVITEYENDIGTAVCWSGNGVNLAVGTESGMVQIWNMSKKKIVVEEKCCGDKACTVTALQWHPMQHSLAWACSAGKISRRDFRDNLTTEVINAHDGCICNLRYSPRANYLCSCGQDGYVRIWRGDSCEPYMEIEMSNPVRAVAWHPWRSGILAIGEGLPASGSLSVWNVSTTKLQYMGKPTKPVAIKALEFNKVSGELVCSQWVCRSEKEQCEIVVLGGPDFVVDFTEEKTGCVTSLLWNHDGTKLGTAGSDETFKIWKFLEQREEISKKRNKNYGLKAFNECHLTVR